MKVARLDLEIYLNSGFPNTRASAIQAVRVAESFATMGIKTTFFYRHGQMTFSAWRTVYGVGPHFTPREYPGLHLFGQRLPGFADLVARLAFAAKVVAGGQTDRRKILYGWNPGGFPIGFFLALRKGLRHSLPLIACEAHEGKDWANTALGDADVIIAVSGGVKQDLLAQGIAAEKIIVAHDGVDLSPYNALRGTAKATLRAQLGLPLAGPLAMFTGHLYPTRGAETVVEAIRALPDVQVVFVGGLPEDRARVRRTVTQAQVQDQVLFIEERPPSEIPRYQMAADVLLIPYSDELPTKAWCSPMKLFEYMASAVPIVASDLSVFHEVAEGEKEIVYVPSDDPQTLAEGIIRVLRHPSFAETIGQNALRKVDEFRWEARAKRIGDFIEQRLG